MFLINAANDTKDFFDQQRRKPHGWFVEQDHFGTGHDRATDSEHLLFASGEVASQTGSPLLKAREVVKDFFDIVLDMLITTCVGPQTQVFDNVHVLDKAATFHDLENPSAHNFIRVTIPDRLTFKMDRALGHLAILSLKQSRNSFESR